MSQQEYKRSEGVRPGTQKVREGQSRKVEGQSETLPSFSMSDETKQAQQRSDSDITGTQNARRSQSSCTNVLGLQSRPWKSIRWNQSKPKKCQRVPEQVQCWSEK